MPRIFILQCPACGMQQRFESRTGRITPRTVKQCVYCGTRFKVLPAIVREEV